MKLSVKISNLELKNPVTVASGTFGAGKDYFEMIDMKALGAVVPKTVTLHAKQGNPPPRIMETPSGMVNAIGIENPGIDVFIKEKLPHYAKAGIPIIASISGYSDEERQIMIEKLNDVESVSAIELNLSCPNLNHKNLIAQDTKATYDVVHKAKKVCKKILIPKLSPNVTDISEIALAAESAGADAIAMINTFQALVIDVDKRKSCIGNFTGGLSGPAIRPIAVNMVYQTAKKIKIPIIAMGGIANANDALQFLIAGATMVSVGTMNFINPQTPIKVIEGIKAYLNKHKIEDINEIIGCLK